jgi:peptidoglycan hydrolase-like protein with peptidoglycan-binding domain
VRLAGAVVVPVVVLASCGFGEDRVAITTTSTSVVQSTGGGTGAETTAGGGSAPRADAVVVALQSLLGNLGYYRGVLDATFGSSTEAALASFQRDEGLPPTGRMDSASAKALAAVGAGSARPVEVLQAVMTELGFYRGQIDGIFGPATRAAIEASQRAAAVTVDGVYGPRTAAGLARLYQDLLDHLPAAKGATPTPGPAGDGTLQAGGSGDAVAALQRRLADLGFRPGPADGRFRDATASAVVAFQKHEGLARDGRATPEVLARLAAPTGAGPRSTAGPRIEVDLDRQLAFVVSRDGTVAILDASTGSGRTFADRSGTPATAVTPVGSFAVQRRVDGLASAPLGTLYRPLFFSGAWAIHGSPLVPSVPGSDGCVRLSKVDEDYAFATVPDGAAVVIYGATAAAGTPNPAAAPGF